MEFLRLLEGIRSPGVSAFMSSITFFGDETVFMALAVTLFWCVSKRQGLYVYAVGLGGTVLSQWLKLIFRIPRPWVLDPNFTIVEAAREGAGGYSFPSGHTQGVVGSFGSLALSNKQVWLRVVCCVLILLVPFSRMYLGVHTPLDVGVAFACAVALVLAFFPCFRDDARMKKCTLPVYLGLFLFTLCFAIWVNTASFPADVDVENLTHGSKNSWSLLGAVLGMIVSYIYDDRKLHFDVKAPFLGQVCKVVLGLALVMGLRMGLKPLLTALAGDAHWTNAVRYCVMVLFAGCVWPMTFPYFAKLGAKKDKTEPVK
ncbi:MAG: phosphatase PAP2 family protein [Oscillospiraceae bacterium]|nr:phosphatase PAP2 family protein [Oscillospiraceae bacterium]